MVKKSFLLMVFIPLLILSACNNGQGIEDVDVQSTSVQEVTIVNAKNGESIDNAELATNKQSNSASIGEPVIRNDYSSFIGEWQYNKPDSAWGITLTIDSVKNNNEMCITVYNESHESLMIVNNQVKFNDINMGLRHNSDSYLVELTFYDDYILATVYSKERYLSDDIKKVNKLENYVDEYRLTSDLVEKDNAIQSSVNESAEASMPMAPNQSYVGAWYITDDDYDLDYLIISEITDDTITFELGFIRVAVIWATSKIENNEINFGENISLDYDGPALNGTLVFYENSISVIIRESEFDYIEAGTIYNFAVKDENFIWPELEALNLVKNYIASGDDSIFEPLISSDSLTYKLKNSNFMIQYDSKIENGHHLIHLYEIVIDDPITGEGHTATGNWYDVDIYTGEILPMFNEDDSLNENY